VRWLRVALLVSMVGLIGFAGQQLGGERTAELLVTAITWIRDQGGWGWGWLTVGQVLVCIIGVVPASIVVIASGALYGLWYGFLLAVVATLLGALGAFLAGRFLVGQLLRRWIGGHLPLMRVNEEVTEGGWRFVLLLRMSPLFPFALVSYGLGLSNIRLRDFVIGYLGSLPSLFALTYTGAVADDVAVLVVGGNEGGSLVESGALGLGLLATFVAVGALTKMAYRVVRKLAVEEAEE